MSRVAGVMQCFLHPTQHVGLPSARSTAEERDEIARAQDALQRNLLILSKGVIISIGIMRERSAAPHAISCELHDRPLARQNISAREPIGRLADVRPTGSLMLNLCQSQAM